MAHVECLYAVLSEYLAAHTMPNHAEFLGIYGRLCINGFNLLDEEMNSIGTAIYLATSIIDHSCRPNAVATFDGPQISIRLVADIPELDWSQIKIAYVDTMNLRDVSETNPIFFSRSFLFTKMVAILGASQRAQRRLLLRVRLCTLQRRRRRAENVGGRLSDGGL